MWKKHKERKAEREQEKERIALMHHDIQGFLSMSEGAKLLISTIDRFSESGREGCWTRDIEHEYYRQIANKGYQWEYLYDFAKDDYNRLIAPFLNKSFQAGVRGDKNVLSAEYLKSLLFKKARLIKLAKERDFSLGDITAREWDLIVDKYVRCIAGLRRRDAANYHGLLAGLNSSDKAFQRLAYIEQAWSEIASGKLSDTDVSESQWLESFNLNSGGNGNNVSVEDSYQALVLDGVESSMSGRGRG